MMYLSALQLLAFLVPDADARPAAEDSLVPRLQPCTPQYQYKVTSETVVIGAPHLVTGWSCTSLSDAPCTLTHSATYTTGTIVTVGGGLSGTLELSSVFTAGADAGFTYSWTTSSATGTSAEVECPAGGYECGIEAIVTMIETKGIVTPGQVGNCLSSPPPPQPFTVQAPKTISGVPADQAAVMDFKACYSGTDLNQQLAAQKVGLLACGSTTPLHLEPLPTDPLPVFPTSLFTTKKHSSTTGSKTSTTSSHHTTGSSSHHTHTSTHHTDKTTHHQTTDKSSHHTHTHTRTDHTDKTTHHQTTGWSSHHTHTSSHHTDKSTHHTDRTTHHTTTKTQTHPQTTTHTHHSTTTHHS